MRRVDLGVVGQQVGEPVRGGVLVADQVVGVLGAEQVGATGGAEQQRAAGEHADRAVDVRPVALCQGVGEVGERVAGGSQRGDAHPSTHLDDLSVRNGGAVEGHVVLAVDEVLGTGALRESEPAGDVVVVDVGLEDVGEAHVVLLEQGEDAVDVALRVDHEGDLAVVHEVAAVAERRGLDRDDGDATSQAPHGAAGLDPGGTAGDRGVEARGTSRWSSPSSGCPTRR